MSPPTAGVTSEPEIMEDADTYVRRMMKSRGLDPAYMDPDDDAAADQTNENFDKSMAFAKTAKNSNNFKDGLADESIQKHESEEVQTVKSTVVVN